MAELHAKEVEFGQRRQEVRGVQWGEGDEEHLHEDPGEQGERGTDYEA